MYVVGTVKSHIVKVSIETFGIQKFQPLFCCAVGSRHRGLCVFPRSMESALQCLWHDETLLTLYACCAWAAAKVPA